jgi:hypothetical protein
MCEIKYHRRQCAVAQGNCRYAKHTSDTRHLAVRSQAALSLSTPCMKYIINKYIDDDGYDDDKLIVHPILQGGSNMTGTNCV